MGVPDVLRAAARGHLAIAAGYPDEDETLSPPGRAHRERPVLAGGAQGRLSGRTARAALADALTSPESSCWRRTSCLRARRVG